MIYCSESGGRFTADQIRLRAYALWWEGEWQAERGNHAPLGTEACLAYLGRVGGEVFVMVGTDECRRCAVLVDSEELKKGLCEECRNSEWHEGGPLSEEEWAEMQEKP